ncbi:H-type lectin domain-containing protein [Aestuariivita sp.]|jgi:hypothetical protein|uniref:H-type lectin domain-containing protein n=1 Tax=Aestuariivita sp. TaxID=1872407 RepID=UPI002173E08D|nr:H-type lectin domain-containing protein [Aestuariivita sp.]MCE8008478.1 hypothetical protein [Aestuariivita sp.]
MKRVASHLIGVDQGDLVLFSDYENGGAMWTGRGARQRLVPVQFSQRYRKPPVVHAAMSLLDIATGPSIRADVSTRKITEGGFEILFRTWEDSQVARIRVAWMAIGELPDDEDWELC